MATGCEIADCVRERQGSHAWCSAHLWRLRKHGDVMAHIPIGQLDIRLRKPKPVEPTELEIAMAPTPAVGRGFLWLA